MCVCILYIQICVDLNTYIPRFILKKMAFKVEQKETCILNNNSEAYKSVALFWYDTFLPFLPWIFLSHFGLQSFRIILRKLMVNFWSAIFVGLKSKINLKKIFIEFLKHTATYLPAGPCHQQPFNLFSAPTVTFPSDKQPSSASERWEIICGRPFEFGFRLGCVGDVLGGNQLR